MSVRFRDQLDHTIPNQLKIPREEAEETSKERCPGLSLRLVWAARYELRQWQPGILGKLIASQKDVKFSGLRFSVNVLQGTSYS